MLHVHTDTLHRYIPANPPTPPSHRPKKVTPTTTTYTSPSIHGSHSQPLTPHNLTRQEGSESHTLPFAYSHSHSSSYAYALSHSPSYAYLIFPLTLATVTPSPLTPQQPHYLNPNPQQQTTNPRTEISGFRYRIRHCPFLSLCSSPSQRGCATFLLLPSYFVLRTRRAFCIGRQKCGEYESGRCCI